ncbi:hypothetical protein BV20DRAFT_1056130 [Pilatotrama ljubarskyi]|nr:hypothetical protein BV20DRAFT_1056130 [Pilatotrama ljubarskyi]
MAITWRETYKSVHLLRETLPRPSLHQVMLQNGSLYFCTLLCLNILDIVVIALQIKSTGESGSYVTQFLDPISSILSPRFLLDLRDINQSLNTGGSSISAGSIEFAGADLQSGQLRSFWDPAIGPLHDSAPDDEDLPIDAGRMQGDGITGVHRQPADPPDFVKVMPSSTPSSAAETIELYQQLIPNISCGIAVSVLLLYDTLLCADRESRLIWQRSKSVASALYFVNRYLPIVWNVLPLFTIYPVSDERYLSSPRLLPHIIISCLSLLGPAVFASLRVYALSEKSKALSAVTLVLSLAPFLITTTLLYRYRIVNYPAPINCTSINTETPTTKLAYYVHPATLASRACQILADLLVIGVTWRTTFQSVQMLQDTLRRPSLHQVLLQNGSIYFCTLASLYILDVALEVHQISSIGQGGSYVTAFLDPLSSILNSRFLLDLREIDEKLVAGGSSVSQGSLHFAGADLQPSVQLPSFGSADHLED